MAPRKGKKIEVGNSSNESDTRAPDPEPPVYVSYADFQTLTRNMEAFKAGYGHKRFGSDGDSFRDSSEDNSGTDDVGELLRKRRRWSSTTQSTSSSGSGRSGSNYDKEITSDISEVPAYKVHCCRQHFSSTQALFAHLRLSHKIGIQPNMTRRCKLCRSWVNEDLLMLHVELLHTITTVKSFEIIVGFMKDDDEYDTETRFVELVPRRN